MVTNKQDTQSSVPPPVLYIKPLCPWCVMAVRRLKELGVPFESVNVLIDREAYRRMQELSGQRLTPTLHYKDRVLADFGPPELEQFIAQGHLAEFLV